MAKFYKVLALSVGALNNKILSSGDVVEEGAFPADNIAKLVEQGFIVETEPVKEKQTKKTKKDNDINSGKSKN
ncbi:MAG: hypothetical protein US15_C0012G0005 [Candidatus Moranbacteria bacterium GW2011_GWF1_36_4]|nr:MAG: hypothetical protein US15_C0012G0005 [Candidatus Moranbacteria bacterium GW2011_GWF1_36_4]